MTNDTATTATGVSADVIATAAERLRTAAETGVATGPVRDLIGRDDIQAAYAVQNLNLELAVATGRVVVGRKIGLTSEAVQKQIGVDTPDFGWLTDDMAFTDGDTIPFAKVLQPKAEAEVAFVLRADLADGELDYDQVKGAIDYGVAAIEVCGSRVADWDISFGDTVADNASSGVYVLGTERKTLEEFTPVDVSMSMEIDGVQVSTGSGAACLGDPVNAVAWLARYARDFGEPLRAGQVLLSGALGPMAPITPGARVDVTISGLGTVSAVFSE
ncbi:2-keto-4-pentenoate hydratase [Nocardioides sp. Kera G14]|uniref:2-keto-4-pentenoate hydratase n=1 Tax=Nocardioides sp. Kera G14 TaxID=2884264 RepID=UPI001D100C3E|nr:fumarylacetoacetate hydrolase family protein [Nocardioides sp. Kera G14]UDY23679.1 fumarylacetoacetate hydrolase family protein [Nocardioides sp. Kera G14]